MKIPLYTRISGLTLLLFFLVFNPVFSQTTGSGKEFWFSIPHCMRSVTENIRWGQYAINLWIFSDKETQISLSSADGSLPNQSHIVKANECKIVSISDHLECKTSEVIRPNGIHIEAQDPVTLTVFTAYKWTGEAYNVIPIKYLGTEYYTLNLYQDHCKMADGETEYKPAQILVTASEDGTELSYTPTVKTEGDINPGETETVSMNEGESFLIQAKVVPGLNQYDETDLTGTHITANKPVFVQSGHTKGAFPRYPVIFLGALKSDFMRNMLMEAMPPTYALGNEYVSVPIKYLDRYNYGTIDDDEGDLIKIVATEDDTDIYTTDKSGSLKFIFQGLGAGDWRVISSQENAAYYYSNHPILIGQYGKSWWLNAVETEKDGDNPQNPPRNGQGMMLVLTPVQHWTSYASFYSPPDMDNFVYITYSTGDYDKISLDGFPLQTFFGIGGEIEIPGSDYSYTIGSIAQGTHNLIGNNNTKFAVYAYGNWDYAKDGFAFGYPVANINWSGGCNDSIFTNYTFDGHTYDIYFEAVDIDEDDCTSLIEIEFDTLQSYNMDFQLSGFSSGDKSSGALAAPIDLYDTAKAVIKITSFNSFYILIIDYYPEIIRPDAPVLISPENFTPDLPNNLDLSWYEVQYADSYDVLVSINSEFKDTAFYEIDFNDTKYNIFELQSGGIYYWKARASNSGIKSEWSETWQFSVAENAHLNPPLPLKPKNDTIVPPDGIVFNWDINNEAYNYCEVRVASKPDFSNAIEYSTEDAVHTSMTLDGLELGTQYYWKVRVSLVGIKGPWSETCSFTTLPKSQYEGCTLIQPPLNSEGQALNIWLKWSHNPNAVKGYDLLVANDYLFADTLVFENTADTTYYLENLWYSSDYFWKVRACYDYYKGPWSEEWNFITEEKTGLNDPAENSSGIKIINISPNPAQGHVNIELSSSRDEKAELKLVNSLGQKVYSQEINISEGSSSISIKLPGSLPNGAYILIINTGSGQLSAKLVIE